METIVVRLSVADRPGALGAVASRIGAVGGSVVGIEILERSAGTAVDEIAVELPDPGLAELLVREVTQVDGVEVEMVEPLERAVHDPRVDALETAAMLVGAATTADLIEALLAQSKRAIGARRATTVPLDEVFGDPSFDLGARDVAWAPMPGSGLALVLERGGVAFRSLERRHLAALARIADARHGELTRRSSRRSHPAGHRG